MALHRQGCRNLGAIKDKDLTIGNLETGRYGAAVGHSEGHPEA